MSPSCTRWRSKIVLFSILALSSLSALAQTPAHELKFSLWNDNWGGNLTQVYDDYRTLAFELEYKKSNRWGILARFSQLSTRYEPDSLLRQTTDEWVLQGSYALVPYQLDKRFQLEFMLGTVYIGSQAGEKLQAFTHETFGVAPSNLIPATAKKLYLSSGYQLGFALLKNRTFLQRQTRISLTHQLNWTPGYALIADAGIRLEFKNDFQRLRITPGYVWARAYDPELHVNNTVLQAESGLSLDVEFEAQRFFYRFKVFTQQGYCEGGIGLRLFQLKSLDTREGSPHFSVSALGNGLGYDFTLATPDAIFRKFPYRFIGQYQFNSYLRKYFPLSPQVKAHGNSLSGGISLDLVKAKAHRWITPYTSLTGGFKHIAVYSKVLPINLERSWHLTANHDLGIVWSLPTPRWLSSTKLQLLTFHRFLFQYGLSPDKESNLVNEKNSPYRAIQRTIGIGARFRI